MAREFQLTDAYLAHHYDARGLERPPAGQSRTTQDWYARQGYELVAPKDPGPEDVFAWKEPASGKTIDVPIIYMKKDVTS